MLSTPRWMLGEGYPLCTKKAQKDTCKIWERAFEIHETVHLWNDTDAVLPDTARKGTIDPITNGEHYCECYLRAWLELSEQVKPVMVPEPIYDIETFERVI